ncbi:MAG: hypothetical protein JJU00_01325 [Opitutales bacterium]|nr:hypothetical protein [Opitutales bacterium]
MKTIGGNSDPEPEKSGDARCPYSLDVLEAVRGRMESAAARMDRPVVVALGGPGGTGKSTIAHFLCGQVPGCAVLPLDDYRKSRADRFASGLLGSHPEGNRLGLLRAHLETARRGEAVERPVFDSVAGEARTTQRVGPARILLAEGEIAAHRCLSDAFDLRILVEAHWRTQLHTRLTRDIRERKYSLERAIEVYLQSNLRDYPAFADPEADIILYRTRNGRLKLRMKPRPSGD